MEFNYLASKIVKPKAKATTAIKSKFGATRSPRTASPRTPVMPKKLSFTFEYLDRTFHGEYTYKEFMEEAPKYLKHKYGFLPKQLQISRAKSMWEKRAAEEMKNYETPYQRTVRLAKEKAAEKGNVGKGHRLKPLNLFSDGEPESIDLSSNIEQPVQQSMPLIPKPLASPLMSSTKPGFIRQKLDFSNDADNSSSERSSDNNNVSYEGPLQPRAFADSNSKIMISNAFVPLSASTFYPETKLVGNSKNSNPKVLTTTIERVSSSAELESSPEEDSRMEESTLISMTDIEAVKEQSGERTEESTILLSTDNETAAEDNADKKMASLANVLISEPIKMDIPDDDECAEQHSCLVDFY